LYTILQMRTNVGLIQVIKVTDADILKMTSSIIIPRIDIALADAAVH